MLAHVDAPEIRTLASRRSLRNITRSSQSLASEAEGLLRDWAFVQAMTDRVKNSMIAERAGSGMATR